MHNPHHQDINHAKFRVELKTFHITKAEIVFFSSAIQASILKMNAIFCFWQLWKRERELFESTAALFGGCSI